MDQLQEIGGGDIGHVEGRILAHQHHVEFRQVPGLHPAQRMMIALHRPDVQGVAPRHHPAVVQGQPLRREVPQGVASGLGLQHQEEGRVGLDVDPLDGVHLDGDL